MLKGLVFSFPLFFKASTLTLALKLSANLKMLSPNDIDRRAAPSWETMQQLGEGDNKQLDVAQQS